MRCSGSSRRSTTGSQEEAVEQEMITERLQQLADERDGREDRRDRPERWDEVEKQILIQTLDHHWKEHLATLDALRQVIHLRSYAQKKPIDEYKQEAFLLFERLLVSIREEVTRVLMRAQVQLEAAPLPELPDFITQHIDPFSGDDDTADIDAVDARPDAEHAALLNIPQPGHARARGRRRGRSAGQPQRAMPVRVGPEIQALPRPARPDGGAAKPLPCRSTGPRCGAPIARMKARSSPSGSLQARLSAAELGEATAIARALVKGVRAHKPSGIDAFLHAYDLGSDEGIAMMCLAEALLRIPDAHTADELIADKLVRARLVGSARTIGLGLRQCRDLLAAADRQGARRRAGPLGQLAGGARARGRPAGRAGRAHRGARSDEDPRPQFRLRPDHRRSAEACRARAEAGLEPQLRHARRGGPDLRRRRALCRSLSRRARPHRQASPRAGFASAPGISVKLTALHPRFEFSHRDEALGGDRAGRARAGAQGVARPTSTSPSTPRKPTGSSCRWTCSRRCWPTTNCSPTAGAASGSRSRPIRSAPRRLCDWVVEAARAHGRKLMVRLVKGAYWDTEIKAAQVGGLPDYPVFTRKVATDVSYLACARKLLAAPDVIYPAFATHNANTIGQIKALAAGKEFEFQRLHGMGEELYEELARLEGAIGDAPDAGSHLRASRQPQGIAGLSRPAAARERRQFELRQPNRR